jgi:4-hydroxythreonine-4-phosphate dehydrogenase
VILKAFEDPMMLELCIPIIYGSPKVAAYHRKAMDLQPPLTIINSPEEAKENRLNLLTTFEDEVKVDFGQPTEESEEAARKAMQRAKEDLQKGLYDVLVMAPVKPTPHPAKEDKALTVMLNDVVRIGLVTTHLPIKEVAQAITVDKIVNKGTIFHQSLKRDFRISNPRMAVLALNPQQGTEEQDVIIPAIEEMEKNGIQAFGPYAADEFFGNAMYYDFDGVLAMYDDQGILPFKTLAREYGVKMKAGITAICITPDHGPAFDIAGKGVADEMSMRHAIYTAIDMFRHRLEYDEPMAHPLPKLYHEKREDGDKARFAVRAKDLFRKPETSEDKQEEK